MRVSRSGTVEHFGSLLGGRRTLNLELAERSTSLNLYGVSASEVRQADAFAGVVGELEVGRLLALLDHRTGL